MKGKMIQGHALAAYPSTALDTDPYVTMKRLGSEDPYVFFTPDEARDFGVAMIDASENAKGGRKSVLIDDGDVRQMLAYFDYMYMRDSGETGAPSDDARQGAKVLDMLRAMLAPRKV